MSESNHIEYLFINPHSRLDSWDSGWRGSGWYFWDENESYCYGPYESAEKAKDELYKYNKRLEEGTD